MKINEEKRLAYIKIQPISTADMPRRKFTEEEEENYNKYSLTVRRNKFYVYKAYTKFNTIKIGTTVNHDVRKQTYLHSIVLMEFDTAQEAGDYEIYVSGHFNIGHLDHNHYYIFMGMTGRAKVDPEYAKKMCYTEVQGANYHKQNKFYL